jgi:hypothetical protein
MLALDLGLVAIVFADNLPLAEKKRILPIVPQVPKYVAQRCNCEFLWLS